MIRPTAYLRFAVREDLATEDVLASLTRSYAYIAPLICEASDVTKLTVRVKLQGRPYWDATEPEQNAVWNDIMLPWLEHKLRKIKNTAEAYNNDKARSFCGALSIERFTIELESCSVTYQMEDGRFPDAASLDDVRAAVNETGLQKSARCVRVPPAAMSAGAASEAPIPWEFVLDDGTTVLYDHEARTLL